MEILRSIQLYAEAREMRFLVIGGHAVNAYGISRQTGDLDILVRLEQKADWQHLMTRIKYMADQCDDRFARFRPPDLAAWPIDFMFVDDTTFDRLYSRSEPATIGVAETRIPSARHLLTLKLHALNQGQEHRFQRDFNDAAGLLRSGKTGVTRADLLHLCTEYADRKLYDRLASEVMDENPE